MSTEYPVDVWNQRYSNEEYAFGTDPNEFLMSVAPQIPTGPVLCLAEGEGRNAVFLAQLGYDVTAVDGSSSGMKKARLLAEARGVQIHTCVSDLAEYEIHEGKWSGIVSIFAHLPGSLRKHVNSQVVRGLRPGGVFILEAYRPAQVAMGTGGPKTPDLLMQLSDLRLELEGLDFLIGIETEREVIEGSYHTGRAAVVQVLAKAVGSLEG